MVPPQLIPWQSKQEWLTVYQNAYSKDYEKTKTAVKCMKEWRHFMGNASRPGMDLTCDLLEIELRDGYIYPDAEQLFDVSELQIMYSTHLMRFLNLIVNPCSDKKDKKKVSLYARARELGIPEWIVNIRHEVAHRNYLASIDVTRMGIKFVLDWLRTQYWEYEKDGMTEMIREEEDKMIPYLLSSLLNIYIILKEQSILGFKSIRDIQDPDIKQFILEINSFRFIEVKMKCRIWEVEEGEDLTIPLQRFLNSPIRNAINVIFKLLKPYLFHNYIYGVCTIDILVEKMIKDSQEHGGMRRNVWDLLLRRMHSWQKFNDLISIFIKKCYEYSSDQSYHAGLWAVELCKALHKLFKVHQMFTLCTELLESKVIYNEHNLTTPLKFNGLNLNELKLLSKSLKLKIGQNNEISLFLKVERANFELKDVLRLKKAILPERWQVFDLLEIATNCPTDFTEHCIIALNGILKSPYSTEDITNLITFTKVSRGVGLVIRKRRRLYKMKHLMKALDPNYEDKEDDTDMVTI